MDLPVPGDYDGTGQTEMAVFRPSTAQWFVLGPNGGRLLGTFGGTNLMDIPVPGDYDGVGHTEMAVYRVATGQWFVMGPNGGHLLGTFGTPNGIDIPVPGDYDHVGHTEMAVFRVTTGQWFVMGPKGAKSLGYFGRDKPSRRPGPRRLLQRGLHPARGVSPLHRTVVCPQPQRWPALRNLCALNLYDIPAPTTSGMIAWYVSKQKLKVSTSLSGSNPLGSQAAAPAVTPATVVPKSSSVQPINPLSARNDSSNPVATTLSAAISITPQAPQSRDVSGFAMATSFSVQPISSLNSSLGQLQPIILSFLRRSRRFIGAT